MSKITKEAAERCANITPREQLIKYRDELEMQAALDGLERMIRERRLVKRTINFPDRRRESDDFGHGL